MPDPWEDAITRLSRIKLERALERLCEGSPALLMAAVTGEPVRVPCVHLSSQKGVAICVQDMFPGWHFSGVAVIAGEYHETEDLMAVTCVRCKEIADGR